MVDPVSDKVSRAPPYSGTASESPIHFAYAAFTLSRRPFLYLSAINEFSLNSPGHPHAALQPHLKWFGLFRVRSPLLAESLLISIPGLLRWFTSPSLAPVAYFIQLSQVTVSLPPGYPIRLSGDRRICAPPPGFSQLITAFFASQLHRHPP